MIFHSIILVLTGFASLSGHCSSHPTPPNQSNPNPSFPVNQRDSQLIGNSTPPSQSNHTPSSTAHPTQPRDFRNPILPFPVRVPPSPSHPTQLEQDTNPIPPSQSPSHSPPPAQNNVNPQLPLRMPPSPDHVIQLEQQCNPTPQSQSPNLSYLLFPVYQRVSQPASSQRNSTLPYWVIHPFFQSPDHSLPSTSSSIRIPWYRGNEFIAIEPAPHGPLPHEFHRMDRLSYCVLSYFFACGLSYTSTWSQLPNLSTSIHIQCFLNQTTFSLFLLANAVFPRARPALAFVLDRLSFFLVVISGYLASMPMFPPYFAIIMFLVVIVVYIFARFRG